MSATERMTTPLVELAASLHRELRRRYPEEARLLEMSGQLAYAADAVDEQVGTILAGFRVDGLRSENFRRKLREFERDFPEK